jgi:peroxiredoxin
VIRSMYSQCLLFACLTLTGCSSPTVPATAGPGGPSPATAAAAPPAAAPAAPTAAPATPRAADAAPRVPLQETPADRLGSVPTGFGLAVGSKAPDATLPDVTGQSQRLSALYASGPVFVVFYRGGWCPFCNLQLHRLATAMPQFKQKGLQIAAISVDTPGEEAKTQAKQGVPFPMLSDTDLAVHKAFHVVHVPPDAEAKALADYGIDLEKYSGQRHHSFAVPAIFLIDRTRTIRWQHVDQDYKTRPTPAQMLDIAARALVK